MITYNLKSNCDVLVLSPLDNENNKLDVNFELVSKLHQRHKSKPYVFKPKHRGEPYFWC